MSIRIFDIQGREVIILEDTEKPAGYHTLKWSGLNAAGLSVASGVYFYRIIFAKEKQEKSVIGKMLLMR